MSDGAYKPAHVGKDPQQLTITDGSDRVAYILFASWKIKVIK